MVIYLPQHGAHGDGESPLLDELTPREIVRELDKYVIGQADAKKAVAIALRNRVRRQKHRIFNSCSVKILKIPVSFNYFLYHMCLF